MSQRMVVSPQPSPEHYSPSERVVRVVADETGVDPLDLPPLQRTIDADALDAAVRGLDDGSVQFNYAGQCVTVRADERVEATAESTPTLARPETTAED